MQRSISLPRHIPRQRYKISSNFFTNAEPKTANAKSRQTWEYFNSLKSGKKTRQKLKGGSHRKSVTVIELNPSPCFEPSSVLMKYMFINRGNGKQVEERKKDQKSMSIDNFKTIDSKEINHCLVLDKNLELKNRTIFAKVSRQTARRNIASPVNTILLRSFVKELMKHKPQVDRGIKCDSINYGYRIMGSHPDRTSGENREYVFRPGMWDTKKKEIK